MGNTLPRGRERGLKSDDRFPISSVLGRSVNCSSFSPPVQQRGARVLWCRSQWWLQGRSPSGSQAAGAARAWGWAELGSANTGAGNVCPVASLAPSHRQSLCRGSSWDRAALRDAHGKLGSELNSPLPIANTLLCPWNRQFWSILTQGFRAGAPWLALRNPRGSGWEVSSVLRGGGMATQSDAVWAKG